MDEELEDCLGNALCGCTEDMARILDGIDPAEFAALDAWARMKMRMGKIEKCLDKHRELNA